MARDPVEGTASTDGGADARMNPSDPGAAGWIEDDGLLRDEGVVFGMSELEDLPASKLEAIQAYYRARAARNEARRQAAADERGRAERRSEDVRERIRTLERRRPQDGANPEALHDRADEDVSANDPGGLLRYGAGILLALGICSFAYFMVRELLGNAFARPELLALGVTLAGMFVVFAPVSVLFSTDDAQATGRWATELWKVRLVEFGMPVLAALFVVTWGEDRGLLHTAAAFLLLSMLFLAGGRLLLSLLARTATEFRRFRLDWRRRRRERAIHTELSQLHERADALEGRLTEIRQRLGSMPTADELDIICKQKIALLRSEFELARAARDGRAVAEILPAFAGEEEAA